MKQEFLIQAGDVAKYEVEIHHTDFDMARDDFQFEILGGMVGQKVVVTKSMMPCDEDGNWFLLFDSTGMAGKVTAVCRYWVPDFDMPDGVREEVDRQYIGFATDSACPQFACECECTPADDHVTYKRVYRGDVHTLYLNLRTTEEDGEHRPLVDSEGEQLRVRKSEEDLN
jgi:hypothetical protein